MCSLADARRKSWFQRLASVRAPLTFLSFQLSDPAFLAEPTPSDVQSGRCPAKVMVPTTCVCARPSDVPVLSVVRACILGGTNRIGCAGLADARRKSWFQRLASVRAPLTFLSFQLSDPAFLAEPTASDVQVWPMPGESHGSNDLRLRAPL
jgi:hypothetical protein